jgi:phosphoesterase family protein
MNAAFKRPVTTAVLAAAAALVPVGHQQGRPRFEKVLIVVLENTDYRDALRQPFLGRIAREGALLSNYHGITHPSQPNYIALTAGTVSGVTSNDPVTLANRHIGDLLDAKGLSWKAYAEDYPGDCYLSKESGDYARKHLPFLSFQNIQGDRQRCRDRVVNAAELSRDIVSGRLPQYSLYVPNQINDGHDTDVAHADRWLSRTFGPLLQDSRFTRGLLFVVTFDESDNDGTNHIYTSLWGAGVRPGATSDARYDHYSLLRTIEDAFTLGTLGKNDATATPISGVWN